MAYSRGWPFCFVPAALRRLDGRLVRVILVAAVFMTALVLLQHHRPREHANRPPPTHRRLEIRFKPSSFDWRTVKQRYPVPSLRPLPPVPTDHPNRLGPVQHDFGNYVHDATTSHRQQVVRAAFAKSWQSYRKHAWLRDELTPVTGRGKTTFGGWAATLIDALDTLWIMGLSDEFHDAAAAAARLDWAKTKDTAANLFETTIRHLAGLISAYDLSGEPALLDKATELGNMLYMAFDTPNRMPGFWFNFQDAKKGRQIAGYNDPSASPCSLSLEFTRLSLLTGDPKYYDAVARITDFLEQTQDQSKLPGMWPKLIDFRDQTVNTEIGFSLGAWADSLYEYLPKMSALLGGRLPSYETMYRGAMETAKKHLLFRPMVPDDDKEGQVALFPGDVYVHADKVDLIPEGQHLSCFAGGMFGLGGKLFDIPAQVALGERLARGCAWAYNAFPTGLMPEVFSVVPCPAIDGPCPWDEERWQKEAGKNMPRGFKSARDTRYILRPEAIESLFLLYRMTGQADLREKAWRMFQAIMNATETPLANSAIADVTVSGKPAQTDSMESFWLAETLKYFYLIFSPPDLISLDEFVFNTEAHPFRRAK
ncbi:glycoside hydrolase family 47 protein [Parathielavia hyrcaniae]|uniref:alpha-1,2-Mannosidase n=1 Tax=Parathielavia hyrcaniae TaxID=113614 RepID=A0AAN6SXK6_9PEZI|nr:glycoside hydrolase family 47 protein [Parathielavia hyrcaniae]